MIIVGSQEYLDTTRIEIDTLFTTQHSESAYQDTQVVRTLVQHAVRSAAQVQSQGGSQSFDEVSPVNNPSHVSLPLPEQVPPPSPPIQEQPENPTSSAPVSSSAHLLTRNTAQHFAHTRCPVECRCCCHRTSSLTFVPTFIGSVYIPKTLLSSLWSSTNQCDYASCKRRRDDLMTIRYYLPTWFAEVDATIRFKAFPLHFCIQTPRVVESLGFLVGASMDEIQIKLSTREMTVNDVDREGLSVLHVMLHHFTIFVYWPNLTVSGY